MQCVQTLCLRRVCLQTRITAQSAHGNLAFRSESGQISVSSWSVPGDILVGIRPDPGQFQVISGSVSGQILVTVLSGAC